MGKGTQNKEVKLPEWYSEVCKSHINDADFHRVLGWIDDLIEKSMEISQNLPISTGKLLTLRFINLQLDQSVERQRSSDRDSLQKGGEAYEYWEELRKFFIKYVLMQLDKWNSRKRP